MPASPRQNPRQTPRQTFWKTPRQASLRILLALGTSLGLLAACGGGNLDRPEPVAGLPENGTTVVAQASVGSAQGLSAKAPPPSLEQLKGTVPPPPAEKAEDISEIRLKALRDAALSYGARGGLAYRTHEIAEQLKTSERQFDQVYAFHRLVLPTPGEVGVVVPPIVVEGLDAIAVGEDGQAASASRRVYRIEEPARIATVAPNWRSYVSRSWTFPEPPPEVLRPSDDRELDIWRAWVERGWAEGVRQAERTFELDLARLKRDFEGIVRYRRLVAEGVIDSLYLAGAELGVTGGGDELKIGERMVRITMPAMFNTDSGSWTPIVIRDGAGRGQENGS